MHVRLGFSVAVHINPDILLIDEVLAVGDASFKAKCYSMVRKLRQSGVTVILVSHDLSQIRNLCDRAMFLQNQLVMSGNVDDVIQHYYEAVSLKNSDMVPSQGGKETDEISNAPVRISNVEFLNQRGEPNDQFNTGDTLRLRISYHADELIEKPAFGISVYSAEGVRLIGVNTRLDNYEVHSIEGDGSIEFIIYDLQLLHGTYFVSITLHDQFMGTYDRKLMAYKFYIAKSPVASGVIFPKHEWKISETILSGLRK
jgi:ABC-type uncharacterized transport system ATPase subunit